jgi:hypothetical protein
MNIEEWTYDDFLGYLLIYASHADFNVQREEVRKIIQEIGRSEYSKLNSIFDKQSDAEHAEIIAYLGTKFCTTPEAKEKILNELQTLLFADGIYKTEEQAFFYGVKMLLG